MFFKHEIINELTINSAWTDVTTFYYRTVLGFGKVYALCGISRVWNAYSIRSRIVTV
jgi:hypothetical protein